jgi:hypothetical protein
LASSAAGSQVTDYEESPVREGAWFHEVRKGFREQIGFQMAPQGVRTSASIAIVQLGWEPGQ